MSHDAQYRILVVDDNPAIHEDFRKIILGHQAHNSALSAAEAVLFDDPSATRTRPVQFSIESAFQGREALEKVERSLVEGRPFAMAFVDVRMPPGWDGIETIAHLWQADPALQVVVCTAYSDYSWDKMTEKLGVSDNLVLLKKPFDNVEVLQLSHALTKKWLVTRQAQLRLDELEHMVGERTAELRSSEERFSQAFQHSPIPQAIQTLRALRFVDVNEAFLRMTGFSREEVIGRTPYEIQLCLDYENRFLGLVSEGKIVRNAEAQISTRGGELRHTLLSLEALNIGGEMHVLLMVQDISERLHLESQLRQAQKMDAVGQLAAGVAHDFNNLLTIIQGHASLHVNSSAVPPEVNASLQQITSAAERAAEITRKLLTFSRRGIMRLRVMDLNNAILSLGGMLRRLIGEKITFITELEKDIPNLFADLTSIEQVLMNLTLNSRDAMADGGIITITTARVRIDEATAAAHHEARTGEFIRLSVTDTGSGMDEFVRSRIFEPFFTTKDVDKGTGMGLATVYGIVKQHQGWIDFVSAPNKGTSFHVYFPVTDSKELAASGNVSEPVVDDGSHTIFVVEDDAAVRALVVEVLLSYKYKVIQAENGDTAIAMWPKIMNQVDVLLTDMVMPGNANGIDVARHCYSTKPGLKVIYTSGYSSELFANHKNLVEGSNYLPKPYLSNKLTAIIQNAIESLPPVSAILK